MDAFKLNKIAGAVLSALLFIFGAKTAFDIAHHNAEKEEAKRVATVGYQLPAPKVTPGGAAPAKEEAFSFAKLAELLPKASAENGEEAFRPCRACHVIEKGDASAKQGPNLYGVAGRKTASVAGFNYSAAMKKHDGEWTWERLATFIHNPKGTVPDTNMAFAGIQDTQELADVLAFLQKKSDTPLPFPAPKAPK